MTQTPSRQLNLGLGTAPYNNQFLFADHYLDQILTGDERWIAGLAEAEAFLTWLRDLYEHEREHLADYSESQLEDHWFIPIFTHLGHTFERQARVPGLGAGVRKPDYVFFPDETTRQEAVGVQKTEDYAQHALAVGEVKAWDVHLSKKQRGGGASFEVQNPSYQIDYYLKATGLTWGILTNGRQWRLLHRESSYRLDTYYEVDLIALLEQADVSDHAWLQAMGYFYLFFRQAAFQPDARGHCFLADVLASSHAYAVALEEDLRESAYLALELLMQGFYDYGHNKLEAEDLDAVHENSLYLLYRLLFVLYGESRGLLPLDNRQYRELFSFNRLKQKIAGQLDSGVTIPKRSDNYYAQLQNLFRLINGNDPDFNAEVKVPRYNGGLFDPQQHPFLDIYTVGDYAFMHAVDLLCRRVSETGAKEFADYRTLNVRHLGSIYEGLLEYRPRRATVPMVAVRRNNGEHWMPAEEAPAGAKVLARRAPGEVYLATDKGERKATGSYYTPQYIVAYIVEQTLRPLVEEEPDQQTRSAQEGERFVDKILSLKVLDPAMGSGHFLVEATDYLARALATAPYVQTDEHEGARESDLNHWRRRVVERCIYGVDKNPLAVELAKLSLWLTTFAGDKPLGFLDHHLKCGDSLVGARVADLGRAPDFILPKKRRGRSNKVAEGQMNLFEYFLSQQIPVMLSKVLEITEVESDSYETVRAKEAADRAMRDLKAPYAAVANLWLSAYFEHSYTQEDYTEAVGLLTRRDALMALDTVQAAQAMAAEHRFFHWELTFPEVYFDRHGQPLEKGLRGFDAVIGNPPYIRSVRLKEVDPLAWAFYGQAYQTAAKGEFDIYLCFIEQGVKFLNHRGLLGMIVPNKWLTTQVGETLRMIMAEQKAVRSIVDFGAFQVFEGVTTYTCLLFLNGTPRDEIRVALLEQAAVDAQPLPESAGEWQTGTLQLESLDPAAWVFALGPAGALLEKLKTLPHLQDIATVFMGTGTRADLVFFMERQGGRFYSRSLEQWVEIEAALMPPALTGQDIDPYYYQRGNALLFPYRLLGDGAELIPPDEMATEYPKAWAYLNHPTNREILESRNQGEFAGRFDWYRHSYPRNLRLLGLSKIVLPDVASQAEFALDAEGQYIIDTVYAIRIHENVPFSRLALTAILNSPIMTFFLQQTGTDLRGGYFRMKTAYLNPFPLPRIDFTTSEAERARLLAEAQARYNEGDTDALLAFTAARLAAEPAQADVIHDLLAYLAQQMATLNEQKQQCMDDFTLDLEGITDADTFAKLQKGKQERTLWKSPACRPFVQPGSYTTHSLEASMDWSEACFKVFVKALAGGVSNLSHIIQTYRTHAPTYAALTQRITATERLIAQIVYQLYSLTADEIAIVEGQTQA